VWDQPGADAGVLEHLERGDADLGLGVIGERVGEDHRAGRGHARRRAAEAAAQCPRRPRGRQAAPVHAEQPFVQPSSRAAGGGEIRQRRQPAAPLRQCRRAAKRAGAQRHAVLVPVPGEELALVARHVDADRTLRFAGAALEAEIEHLVDRPIGQPGIAKASRHGEPEHVGPAARGVRLLACRHVRGAHHAAAGLATGADAAAHLHGPAEPAEVAEVEERLRRGGFVARAEPQVAGDGRRVHDAAWIEDTLGIESPLHFAEGAVELGTKHLLVERAADQAVAVFAREGAAELED
jgi:hypothetical protein